jgi:4-hydroxythreonine-4-phosphate dehydrogenase
MGRDSRAGGQHAGAALDVACKLAKAGFVQGLVTAPISKRSLSLAGYRFTGHTELFAKYFGAPDCQMVMVHRNLRVIPLTRHIPVKRVASALTMDGIVTGLGVVDKALREQFGIPKPRIAVAGLNPHAGEGGVLGKEETEVIGPAIRRARRRGIDANGPFPADALFQNVQNGTFDAFVAMYHDQGLIPFKMVAKRRGVNVTIGLPIVRTSVDHGVAYDIAGTGRASVDSLRAAYQLAEKLVARGRIGTT